jgi:hypothetical protein
MLIDVHAHQFPLKYIETVTRPGRQLLAPLTGETIEERLSLMDAAGVDVQVLSPANLSPTSKTRTWFASGASMRL